MPDTGASTPRFVANTTDIGDGIVAIDTEFMWPQMDASHLVVENGRAAFIDTGTNASVPLLLDALRQQGLDAGDVDYVFVTHVHLDHAGGAGMLMRELPNARCVLHPRGAPHMEDPARLVAGTEAVYGRERARDMYGEIVPIDAKRIVETRDGAQFSLGDREFGVLHTEGHARHHYCLHDPRSEGVFTGDSFGVSYRQLDTGKGEFIFPTTTPTHFDPVEAHRSVERIRALDPSQLYLTHYSRVGDVERLAEDMHVCLDEFVAIAGRHRDAEDREEAIGKDMFEYLAGRLAEHGFAGDREAMWSALKMDVMLNAQGLVAWLRWRER